MANSIPDNAEVDFALRLRPGPVTTMELAGDIDPSDGPGLERLLVAGLEASRAGLIIDVSDVGVFGSGAVRAVEATLARADAAGKTLVLRGVPPQVRTVLDVVGLDVPMEPGSEPGHGGLIAEPDFERIVNQAVLRGRESICVLLADQPSEEARIVFVNRAFTDLTGFSADEAIGQTPKILAGTLTEQTLFTVAHPERAATATPSRETVCYTKDGTPFIMSSMVIPIEGTDSRERYVVAIQSDRTRARRLARFESALTYLDTHDRTTAAADEPDRLRHRVERMLAAQVSLMEGGHGSARLITVDGQIIEAHTGGGLADALPKDLELGSDLRLPDPDSAIRRLGPSGSSMLMIPLGPAISSEVAGGAMVLTGMDADRLRLSDPHLHLRLAGYGLR